MKILGIENRDENWRTAYYFSPFFRIAGIRLDLARRLGESLATQPGDVHINLFWTGIRDYLQQNKKNRSDNILTRDNIDDFAERYMRSPFLRHLRETIEGFRQSQSSTLSRARWILNAENYDVSTTNSKTEMTSNLIHTEIDIVLASLNYLFIGEAKHEEGFSENPKNVLMHQLIREYVMARILVDRLTSTGQISPKIVVPFVVGDDAESLKKDDQIRFMIWRGWLKKENVLTWEEIKKLAGN